MSDLREKDHHVSDHSEHLDASTEQLVAPSRMSPGRRAFNTVVRSREASILLVLVLVIAAATAASSSFLFGGNGWSDLLLTPSILVLLAVGQAVGVITRQVH